MLHTPILRKILFLVLLTLLLLSRAIPVSAEENIWTSLGPEGGTINSLVIDPLTPTTLYAGTDGGRVFKSTNGGESWSALNLGFSDTPVTKILAIDPVTPTILYAGTYHNGLFSTRQFPVQQGEK